MTPENFDKMVLSMQDRSKKVFLSKKGYGTEIDRLSNFKRAGQLQKINAQSALRGMSGKHTISISDMVYDYEHGIKPNPAELEEKIGDEINYLLLLRGLFVDDGILPLIPKK